MPKKIRKSLINFAHHAKDAQRLQQLIQEILELSRGSATIPYAEQEITLENLLQKFSVLISNNWQQNS